MKDLIHERKMYKGSGSVHCDAKMAKLSLSWGTGGTGNIASISPTIQGQLEEVQKSTLSIGRTRSGTTKGSAPMPGGGILLPHPR